VRPLGLLNLRRPEPSMRPLLVLALLLIAMVVQPVGADAQSTEPSATDPPVFAYYYIWFDATSWNRAKTDLPLAGKYSSDERSVMEEHVITAKAAGIDGFIVSWKDTLKLSTRLTQLAEIAAEHDFALVVIYQGLDFDRDPLPVDRVAEDLDFFIATYAHQAAFRRFGKPVVILSGSWEFSAEDVASLGFGRRDDLFLLGSEKNVAGVERLRGLVDGDAYYWSSVNPETYPGYQNKLDAMSAAVHEQGGLWFAPAAAGFDARLIGGTTVVDRLDGEQLRVQYDAAVRSSPDAVGLISWNEFSENSHIEPSRTYGERYVDVVAELLGGESFTRDIETPDAFDSSEPGGRGSGAGQIVALSMVAAVVLGGVVVVGRRRRRPRAEAS